MNGGWLALSNKQRAHDLQLLRYVEAHATSTQVGVQLHCRLLAKYCSNAG